MRLISTFSEKGVNFNWCNWADQPPYDHKLSFRVKVPHNLELQVGTVNEGEILVQNTKSTFLKASNVNGGIELRDVSGKTQLNCINGDVTITYTKNPSSASKYYALNGDMNVSYQNGLSANVSFKTMNGELYTDFDIERQYTETKKSTAGDKGKFKFESRPVLQIGAGDVPLDFETLNGNVYLKKI